MRYLLDTNVVSELRRSQANQRVRRWVDAKRSADLALCAITVFELELGHRRLQRRDPAQAERIRRWLDDVVAVGFAGRILSLDQRVAASAARLHVPDPRPERNAFVAATAIANDLAVVTRNIADFAVPGLEVIDPWSSDDALS